MIKKSNISFLLCFIMLCAGLLTKAQNPMRRLPGGGSFSGGAGGKAGGNDSLNHRTGQEDSITITFRYLDTSRYVRFDSSFVDFSKRFPIPPDYTFLGNTGNAARSLIFNPILPAGWDAGFHAYDIYQFNLAETRFFNTTRPYSELGYILGSRTEQMINLVHTQNITPDWNAAFQYRFINAPGYFKNQNTNHGSFRLNSNYQSKNRRYRAFFIAISNKIQSAENGGISPAENYLDDVKSYQNRLLVPVQLGRNDVGSSPSVFTSTINTGTKYKNSTIMFRQQYDLGRKDSIVTDSSVIPLFYPKLRVEHTFRLSSYTYNYQDYNASAQNADSGFYRRNYDILQSLDTLNIKDRWNEVVNDISVYQFPDEKNAQQFIKVGGSLQNLHGVFDVGEKNYYNIFIHGEYRNKTRNRKWDIEANGQLYLAGFNAGDYAGIVSLRRYISRRIGYLQAGFQNVNRTPSYIYDNNSSFNFGNATNFKKENVTNIFASLEQPQRKLKLTGNYYLVTNYTYFKDYYNADQSSALFNVLQVTADKEFRVSRRWRLYTQVSVQQKAGFAPVNIPLVFTRNRFGYEGNLGFKNLQLHFGTEVKYHTPYKAMGYSPVLGQFYYQNSETIKLRLPEIDLYLHFRIKTFTAYVRGENLNTLRVREKFGFTNNNLAAPFYPYPGLLIRLGIFWTFIN